MNLVLLGILFPLSFESILTRKGFNRGNNLITFCCNSEPLRSCECRGYWHRIDEDQWNLFVSARIADNRSDVAREQREMAVNSKWIESLRLRDRILQKAADEKKTSSLPPSGLFLVHFAIDTESLWLMNLLSYVTRNDNGSIAPSRNRKFRLNESDWTCQFVEKLFLCAHILITFDVAIESSQSALSSVLWTQ